MGIPALVRRCALLAVLAALPAWGEVTVEFVEPERYVDGGATGVERERNLEILAGHLRREGARCLQAGETLTLRVFDVDLAGETEWWWRRVWDVRVLRAITWPALELEYVWRDVAGAPLGAGRERIADLDYLRRSPFLRHEPDLPYEQAMLRDWFERRFCRDRPGAAGR